MNTALVLITRNVYTICTDTHTKKRGEVYLTGHGCPLQLRTHGSDNFRVRPAVVEQTKPAKAINVLPAQDVLNDGSAACPLCHGKVSGLSDGLSVLDEAAVEML